MNEKELIHDLYVASNKLGELCSTIIIQNESLTELDVNQLKGRIDALQSQVNAITIAPEPDVSFETSVKDEVVIEEAVEQKLKNQLWRKHQWWRKRYKKVLRKSWMKLRNLLLLKHQSRTCPLKL